ncbi:uncharacterized protein LOC111050610 [Nilaparvata lugens]|uniref:uncharacterized protein LOC111050610 n=1 Tax=Nilaparvata lugens TaxID=108931 RepID=UPI00193CE449|nr:uncharacterized protein LOC111050610 [Nilaparvata lugens]
MNRNEQENHGVTRIRLLLSYCGMQPPHRGTKLALIFTLLAVYFGIEACISLVKNWHQLHSRLLAFEDIVIAIVMTMCCIEFAYIPNHIQCLLNILNDNYFDGYNEKESEDKRSIITKAVEAELITAKWIEILSYVTAVNVTALPIFVLLKKLLMGESFFENYANLPLPLEYSFTFFDCTLMTYLVIYAVEAIWYMMSDFERGLFVLQSSKLSALN